MVLSDKLLPDWSHVKLLVASCFLLLVAFPTSHLCPLFLLCNCHESVELLTPPLWPAGQVTGYQVSRCLGLWIPLPLTIFHCRQENKPWRWKNKRWWQENKRWWKENKSWLTTLSARRRWWEEKKNYRSSPSARRRRWQRVRWLWGQPTETKSAMTLQGHFIPGSMWLGIQCSRLTRQCSTTCGATTVIIEWAMRTTCFAHFATAAGATALWKRSMEYAGAMVASNMSMILCCRIPQTNGWASLLRLLSKESLRLWSEVVLCVMTRLCIVFLSWWTKGLNVSYWTNAEQQLGVQQLSDVQQFSYVCIGRHSCRSPCMCLGVSDRSNLFTEWKGVLSCFELLKRPFTCMEQQTELRSASAQMRGKTSARGSSMSSMHVPTCRQAGRQASRHIPVLTHLVHKRK